MQDKGFPDSKGQVKHQMFLGDDTFIAEYQQAIEKPEKLCEVSKAHKRSVAITLSVYQRRYSQRVEAMAKGLFIRGIQNGGNRQALKSSLCDCQSSSIEI